MTTCVRCYLISGKLIRDSEPEDFIGGWSHRPHFSIYPNPRLPEGEQVGIQPPRPYSLRIGNHLHQFENGGLLVESSFPDASRGPALQAGLSRDGNLWPAVSSFLHSSIGVELLGPMGTFYLTFFAKLFSRGTAPLSFPPTMCEGSNFSPLWPTLVFVHLLLFYSLLGGTNRFLS